MDPRKRFFVAIAAYVVLGVLVWFTMDSGVVRITRENGMVVEIPFRNIALGILGLFFALTVLRWRIDQREARRAHEDIQE